jgi:hypothetical protein
VVAFAGGVVSGMIVLPVDFVHAQAGAPLGAPGGSRAVEA